MKTVRKLLSIACIALIFACSTEEPENNIIAITPGPPEEEPTPPAQPLLVTYLTVIVDNDYNTNTIPSEDWILVHRENGDLYNYVPLQNGNTVVLEALDTVNLANMTVTKLRVNDFGNKLSYNLQSFGKIQPGRTWTLSGFAASTPLTDLGQVDITVNNVTAWNSYSLTNTQDYSPPSELSQYAAFNPGFDPNIIDINGFTYKQTTDYLMTVIDGNWVPTYSLINGLTDGATITLDGSTQFSAFDQVIAVPVNSTLNNFSYGVSALNAFTNSRFQLYWTSTPNPNYVAGTSSSFSVGYLNAYQDYETNISMGNPNFSYNYSKKGSPIANGDVVFPTATVTLNDTMFTTYDFTSTASPITNASRWGGGMPTDSYKIDWIVYGPTDEIPSIGEMPLVDFPDLDFANISFISTRLFTQGDGYDIYTGSIFGDGTTTNYNPVQEWFEFKP
ncbi:hypothetical protein [Maribacter halichondriae]|uniref:hypothetical protein n=1 Tax=Maribacter halichondriae TaxID=2980554 RepID=UPI00235A0ED3|nr:hypothetical protein [Maribacter sp. Hal144]